uniref:Uncharacterized protein n=1 Tax=Thermus islandicus TaxID=540988 RepID=A0A7C2GGC2_9DEIN
MGVQGAGEVHQKALLEEAERERLLRPLRRGWRRRLARFLLPVKVHVNLPLALAPLVEAFLPEEAKLTLGRQGVNLKDLLALLKEGVPEGKLVEIEAEEEEGPVRILVEVV